MTSQIVFARDGQALTTSEIVASGVGIQHKNLLAVVRKYASDFNEFGRVAFETRSFETEGGTQNREVALLNEQQATLLVTYCRNSEVVRKFKIALVKAFYEMREQLQPRYEVTEGERKLDYYMIRKAVEKRAKEEKTHYQRIYHALYDRFRVASYRDIPHHQVREALTFIEVFPLKKQEALPVQIPEGYALLPVHIVTKILHHCYYWRHLYKTPLDSVVRMLTAVRSPLAGIVWDMVNDLNLGLLEDELAKIGRTLDELECCRHMIGAK